jgi:GTP-binding protein
MRESLPLIAIVGRANVGKSSIFNVMLGEKRSIVAKEAGTTRDSVVEILELAKNKSGWLVDTAGLKKAEDEFEASIQEQITEASESADLIMVVVEASTALTDEDRFVAKKALQSKKPVVLLVNKIDTVPEKERLEEVEKWRRLGISVIFGTSAKQRSGFEELENYLLSNLDFSLRPDRADVSVALIGRPNAGKSSLFNLLAKKQQAIVSQKAGTTRDVNRLSINFKGHKLDLLDTAGIRRSGKIEVGIEKFSVLRALGAIEQSDICLVLMDCNELATALDQKIVGLIKQRNRGLIIVISKWDSLIDKHEKSADEMLNKLHNLLDFAPWAPVIFTSSFDGKNTNKIYDLILSIKSEMEKRPKTSQLNNWLEKVTSEHPPASTESKLRPKLNYIMQEENIYPAFRIYGNHVRKVHWSYRRYLEKKMRDEFGFYGSPVEIWFHQKEVRNKIVKGKPQNRKKPEPQE